MSGQKVGVIGVGAMGAAVATRLLEAGNSVAVYDTSETAVSALVQRGATRLDPEHPDVAILLASLPNDDVVNAALDDDLLSRLSQSLVIELSTILPSTVIQLAQRAQKYGVEVVDAPVSGGPNDALAGRLVLMVGVDDEVLSRAAPVLESLGTVERTGGIGTGKAMKLVNNAMSMANMAVAAEAFTLGRQLGLDDQTMYDVLSRSGGRSNQFNKRIPDALNDDYAPRFALRLGEKDLRLALTTGHDTRHPMPITAAVHQVFEAGIARELGDQDIVAILKLYAN
jgi:3-hydroxyisobutyrate dehydrogenase-like beta-hydroxyacid dehydrogenase